MNQEPEHPELDWVLRRIPHLKSLEDAVEEARRAYLSLHHDLHHEYAEWEAERATQYREHGPIVSRLVARCRRKAGLQ